MCPSCPHACMTPAFDERYGASLSSSTGSASMSARSSVTGPVLAASQRREYARLSNAGTNFVESKAAQLALDEGRRLVLLHRELRMRVKVPAIPNELVVANHGCCWSAAASLPPAAGFSSVSERLRVGGHF